YDRSSWRVGLLQCSHSLKGAQQVRGQSRVVERGKEAMTSLVGLNYPKVNHRLERRWTQRSTLVPQRRIYQLRKKGCRYKSTDNRAMRLAAPWYRRVRGTVPFLLRGVCDKGDREDGTIPEVTRSIKDLVQVGVNVLLFSGKTSCIPEVQWHWEGESQ
ncbi:hypothetical protein BHE74_00021949, partial [Ensete ventricosum]